jgi:TrmH family RNA methyltransferase
MREDPELHIRLVLVRPRNAENLGAAARAMANFGLRDWVWVAPAVEDLGPARRLAVHAGERLESARRAETLGEAVADCAWVVGTSSRRVEGKRRISPRALAAEAVERARDGTVAIVFGDERSGLTNEEIRRCHDLSAVPASDDQPSLNLAQAILLYAYEVRMAALAARPPPQQAAPRAAPATDEDLERVRDALTAALRRGKFLVHPDRHAVRDLMAPLIRAKLGRQEARLWLAALAAIANR